MIKKILGVFVFVLSFSSAFGFTIPNYDGYVTDLTKTLTPDQEKSLETQISDIWKATNTEIAVLIIQSLEGEDIASLAVDVGNKRGVGDKKFDNGVIILIALNDRKWFNAIGYGLEGTLPDAIAKRIGEAEYVPNFKEGKYYEGLSAGIADMSNYILKDPTTVQYYENNSSSSTSDGTDKLGNLIIFYFFICMIFGGFLRSKTKNKGWRKWAGGFGFGTVFGIIGGLITGVRVLSLIAAYGIFLFAFLISLARGGKGGGIIGGGSSGGFGGGGSSGGFGGGSFGGGGGGGNW